MERQHRIVITQSRTWPWLVRQLRRRKNEAVLIVGTGAHARKLINRLVQEIPHVMRAPGRGGEYAAIVNPYAGPLAWSHNSPDKAPVVENTTQAR